MTTQNTINKMHNATVDGASDGLLNKRGLAVKLGISKRTVDAWMKKKRLPFIKVGKTVRFRWPDVLEKLNLYRVN
jgi:excisionase family DNA binding protein